MSSHCQSLQGVTGPGAGPAVLEFLPVPGAPWSPLNPAYIREYFCFLLSSNPSVKSSFTMEEGHVVLTAAPCGPLQR